MNARLISIADYEVIRFLGQANRGELYLARGPERLKLNDSLVVVKVMTGASNAAFEHLVRELRAFAAVSSPYLATLHDAGQHDDVCFYSMTYYEAGSVQQPSRPLSPRNARRAVADAARAADDLHEAGIAHCDIRPATVLLAGDGGRLSDLGLARATAAEQSISSMASISAVGFVDPRLLYGEDPDRASDIYSLGATLHYALTGQGLFPPVPDSEPVLAVRRMLQQPPVLGQSLGVREAELISRCLDPAPSARPHTAKALAGAIDELGVHA